MSGHVGNGSEFCGGELFFDLDRLWYNDYPEFTDCFQQSVLVLFPCAFLWLFVPPYLCYLYYRHRRAVPVGSLYIVKCILTFLLVVISVMGGAMAVVDHTKNAESQAQADVISPFIRAATMCLVMVVSHIQRKRGSVTSGVLFLFWVFETVVGIVPFYTHIMQQNYKDELSTFVIFYIDYAIVLVMLILNCFAEKPILERTDKKPCPEASSSFLSQTTFVWCSSLVVLGYKKALEENDLYDLNTKDKSRAIVNGFSINWEKELRIYKEELDREEKSGKKKKEPSSSRYEEVTEKTPLLQGVSKPSDKSKDGEGSNGKAKEEKEEKLGKSGGLFKAVMKTFGWEILASQVWKLFYDIFTFAQPLLQTELINFVESNVAETWKGYLYAGCVFIVAVLQSWLLHQTFWRGSVVGMRIRTALISVIYRKSLTMTSQARKDSTVGEIVNLMSIDAQRFTDLMTYIWAIWSGPLQTVIAVVFLYNIVGYSVFVGLSVMVILAPINAIIFNQIQKYQEQQMKQKDKRIKLMNEILNGIKVLKLYAWENSFKDKILDIRNTELNIIKKMYIMSSFLFFCWTLAPFMIALGTFTTYVFTSPDHILPADKAFVAITLFNILQFSINVIPFMFTQIIRTRISLRRISHFLCHDDLDPNNVYRNPSTGPAVSITNGTFQWDPLLGPCLKDINISIPEGKLVAVVGQVGSGKSSLISSLLGDMEKLEGRVNVKGRLAFVPQEAWIQNATLRDNITFGKPYNEKHYDTVLDSCALRPDLSILAGGDMTEIGEKGINLSGGQKQRVSLARAVYNDADVYLLDDPLSAVDAHVGKHIFEHVVGSKGLLQGKTRILVTHGVHWLPMVDEIIVLVGGSISEVGSYEQLMTHDGAFAKFLRTYLTEKEEETVTEEDTEAHSMREQMLERLLSVQSDTASSGDEEAIRRRKRRITAGSGTDDDLIKDDLITSGGTDHSLTASEKRHKTLTRQHSRPMMRRTISQANEGKSLGISEGEAEVVAVKDITADVDRLVEDEAAMTGRVDTSVYMAYIRAVGILAGIGVISLYVIFQAATVGANIWLTEWTDNSILQNMSIPGNSSEKRQLNDFYLGIYGGFGLVQGIFIVVYTFGMALRMVVASSRLHKGLLDAVLRSPLSFFDVTPIGRIINRFSKDIDAVDEDLPNLFLMWFEALFNVVSTIIVISYAIPIFLSVIVPLFILYFFLQRFYVATSRQLKRVESNTRSPIFNHFSETLSGASVIRAYREQNRFITESEKRVDNNQIYYFYGQAANRWMGIFLEFVGNLAVLAAALFAVIDSDSMTAGTMGLAITYALQITSTLSFLVRNTSDLETNIVCVERIKEYSEVPPEAEWYIPENKPPHNWPDRGNVEFNNYTTRYREGLDLVLKGIGANIYGGEKIGIIGRTGAGKSSLTLALFRIIESAGGFINIDDIDISSMGLHDLRSKITILPQDPVLFSGTLRMNLDPFDKYTDSEIWRSLEHAHLKVFVDSLPDQLYHDCGEGGQNLSVGQRQLLCLARTLLRKTKILVLDEATAAVDMATDELIQTTIREEFKDCTIITIAHRLNTIMDYDRVMVLDQGLIAEFDSPPTLLKDTNGIFHGMAKNAGLI